MKHSIKDALQIVVALLITGSTAYAMQPSTIQQPVKHVAIVVHNTPKSANPSVKQAVLTSKTVNTATPAQVPVVAPQNPPQSAVTWQSNPNNCDQSTQYIAAEAPFSCINKPVAQPTAPAAPAGNTVSGCGDNSYANYIYMHESGCSTYNPNASSGACGLGQAEPCSKLEAACPNMDYACENAWFTAYAQKYGGWAGAYQFWLDHYWW